MKEIILTLPYSPSINHYKIVGRTVRTKNGKMYQQKINSNDTLAFYSEVWINIRTEMAEKRISIPIDSTIPIEVHIDQHPPDKRRRDVDNCIKIILDSLQRAGLIKDDYQIVRLIATRKEIVPGGKIVVKIKSITEKD